MGETTIIKLEKRVSGEYYAYFTKTGLVAAGVDEVGALRNLADRMREREYKEIAGLIKNINSDPPELKDNVIKP